MRNSCQTAIQNAAVRILSTSVLVRPAHKQRAGFYEDSSRSATEECFLQGFLEEKSIFNGQAWRIGSSHHQKNPVLRPNPDMAVLELWKWALRRNARPPDVKPKGVTEPHTRSNATVRRWY